jgi:hypothetical protein
MRVKKSCDGNALFNGRLVAKGYAQNKELIMANTFSLVARYDTVRTLLALTA